jgi:cysteine-rich repeat protein
MRAVLALLLIVGAAPALHACVDDAGCGAAERCHGAAQCGTGVCVPAFSVTRFPVGQAGATAYTAPIAAVLDHAGGFYTQCCDTVITAFTGETALEGPLDVNCPAAPELPGCFVTPGCVCGYRGAAGGTFTVNGNYVGVGFGTGILSYDGHAGYDYFYASGTPLIALADGMLCKAQEDLVNGHVGAPSAWDKFHTFYVDHGVVGGVGYAAWYLHAADLAGPALQALAPGACAPVVEGQVVATVGNVGTLVSHLHFEIRTYAPAEGPEGPASNVIDPYGWDGAGPDPWTDPLENFQAESRADPLWIACGNGRLECGEECDDGNTQGGDCCASDCALEAGGAPCDDGDACSTPDVCDGAGACTGMLAPEPACRAAARGSLLIRDRFPETRDVLTWKWTRGAATAGFDLGNPASGTTRYDLCIYDESGGAPALVLRAALPPGGTCGTQPCWKAASSGGYRYADRDAAAHGLRTLVLKPGAEGKAKIVVKGKGDALLLPDLPLDADPRVTVQLVSSTGACWATGFDAPSANDDAELKAAYKAPN